jgi:hypothetical protein
MRTVSPRPALLLAPALALLAAAAPAAASESETHDGFFAHASVGYGHTVMTSTPLRIEGDGALINLQAGASLTENLSVFGNISQTQIFAPTFRPNGAFPDDDPDVSASIGAYGAGATWYHLETNLYLSVVAALVHASIEEQDRQEDTVDTRFRTNLGFGGAVTFGKEWWVDDEWGIGGAATAQVSRIADQDRVTWHNGTFGILFSATWN